MSLAEGRDIQFSSYFVMQSPPKWYNTKFSSLEKVSLMAQVFSKMNKGSLMSWIIRLLGPLMAQSAAKGAYSMLYAACAPEAWGELCWCCTGNRAGSPST